MHKHTFGLLMLPVWVMFIFYFLEHIKQPKFGLRVRVRALITEIFDVNGHKLVQPFIYFWN
jgi:hypothetical protein